MTYWAEDNKMIAEMVWEQFEGPKLPTEEEKEANVGELNRKVDNDNVRMCFSWKETGAEKFESCNFFIKNWGDRDTEKTWDGVKEFENENPLDWCSLNW